MKSKGVYKKIVNIILSGEIEKLYSFSSKTSAYKIVKEMLIDKKIIVKEDKAYINLKSKDKEFSEVYKNILNNNLDFIKEQKILKEKILIYTAVILSENKDFTVIKNKGIAVENTDNTIIDLIEKPEEYEINHVILNKKQIKYLNEVEDIFKNFFEENKENKFTKINKAIRKWYISLPGYLRQREFVYKGIAKNKEIIKEKVSVKEQNLKKTLANFENDETEVLIKLIPNIFKSAKELKDMVQDFINAEEELIKFLTSDIKEIFKIKAKDSLYKGLKNWYEKLNQNIKETSFKDGEEILIKFIESLSEKFDNKSIVKFLFYKISNIKINDSSDKSIKEFIIKLSKIKDKLEGYEKLKNKESCLNNQRHYILQSLSKESKKIKRFEHIEIGKKGEFLLKEFKNILSEYNLSISSSEKRQVILELLKDVC